MQLCCVIMLMQVSCITCMKIALAGKGGTGKTAVSTLIITYLSKKDYVLGIDSDSNENLAQALGFSEKKINNMKKLRHFMDEVYSYTKTDPDWESRHVTPHRDANFYHFIDGKSDTFLKKLIVTDGNISVAHLGTVDEEMRGIQSMCGSFGLLRTFLNHLKIGDKDHLIVDLAAGNELLTRATVISMDEVLLIVEPTAKNLSVAQDIIISLQALLFKNVFCIVNKSFEEEDIELVSKTLTIPTKNIRRIPFSTEIIKQDNNNKLTFDTAPQEAQDAISQIVKLMREQTHYENKLIERANMIDRKLFPNEKSKLTEEVHI